MINQIVEELEKNLVEIKILKGRNGEKYSFYALPEEAIRIRNAIPQFVHHFCSGIGKDEVRRNRLITTGEGKQKRIWESIGRYLLDLDPESPFMARRIKYPGVPDNWHTKKLYEAVSYTHNAAKAWRDHDSRNTFFPKLDTTRCENIKRKGSKNTLTYDQRKKVERKLKSLKRKDDNFLSFSEEELVERLIKELGFLITPCNVRSLMKKRKKSTTPSRENLSDVNKTMIQTLLELANNNWSLAHIIISILNHGSDYSQDCIEPLNSVVKKSAKLIHDLQQMQRIN